MDKTLKYEDIIGYLILKGYDDEIKIPYCPNSQQTNRGM